MYGDLRSETAVADNVVGMRTIEASTAWCQTIDVEPAAAAETILLVEDEAFVREVTCEVLRSAGYRVVVAQNATEALHAYDRCCGEVDLLLTDVILPGETGRVLVARLRRRDPGLRALFVTGYAEQMGLRESQLEGCLAKPFSTDVLLRRVRQLLDRAPLQTGGEGTLTRACGAR